MASVKDFQTRFPEFCNVVDSRVQLFLDDAALIMTSKPKWLSFYDVAQLYLTAHFMVAAEASESGDSGIIAPVKKQEVDDVVIEHAIADIDANFEQLTSTTYGKRYISYRHRCLTGPRIA